MKLPIRVAIIGCGAISQQWHIPIIEGSDKFELTALVDFNSTMLNELSESYHVEIAKKDYQSLPLDQIDAVVVATPVALHYQIAKFFIENKKHVFVEKPIAINFTQSKDLVQLAEANSVILSVGLYRRLYPSISLLKEIIEEKTYGSVVNFKFNWGGVYNWGATSLGNMKKDLAGGGVLMDLGPHALDWLTYVFGEHVSVIEYKDDSDGGIDADCEIKLQFNYLDKPLSGNLNLSRLRDIGGELQIECEEATLSLGVGQRFDVRITPKKANMKSDISLLASDVNQIEYDWNVSFQLEFDDFSDAIVNQRPPILSGNSVLPAMKVIEQCYESTLRQQFEWEKPLSLFTNLGEKKLKILVTGASGFIGGRVCEALMMSRNVEIVAAVNNPNNASRISRLNTNMIQLDITDAEKVEKAVQSCDAIVHCAIGTSYGDDSLVEKVTVGGTTNLLNAAIKHRISKFIYVSSLAVVDPTVHLIDENSKLSSSADIYSKTKCQAEKAVLEADDSSMIRVIFRPSNVYGPYSALFKVGAGAQLVVSDGIQMSKDDFNAPANVVYVDNVVEAILRALTSTEQSIDGKVYYLDDGTGTFGEFFNYFCQELDKECLVVDGKEKTLTAKSGMISDFQKIARSKKTKAFLKQFYESEVLGKLPRKVFDKYPSLANKFKNTDPLIYKSEADNRPNFISVEPYTKARISTDALERDLNFKPIIDQRTGLSMTFAWLSFSKNL